MTAHNLLTCVNTHGRVGLSFSSSLVQLSLDTRDLIIHSCRSLSILLPDCGIHILQ
ncbi:hypothetical protein MTR67_048794 [Solanum verrucosum]|uniref:Uncharacterized protein n=1 Tax=Solanum verrucosum TaxID=315347 RepID=A0AAF0V1I0_SOLVR|nr:hypothetical protein MTR67_048794 [Solanum verrucosum]